MSDKAIEKVMPDAVGLGKVAAKIRSILEEKGLKPRTITARKYEVAIMQGYLMKESEIGDMNPAVVLLLCAGRLLTDEFPLVAPKRK